MKSTGIFFVLLLICPSIYGQSNPEKPYKCGFIVTSLGKVNYDYENYFKFLGCKSGETIASIGAGNGYIEVQIATIIENVHWFIQDIDTDCCNQNEFENVVSHYEELKGSSIQGTFDLVIGEENKTNLPKSTFDRVIFHNSYHEISQREEIMNDVKEILKPGGEVVIMERITKKKNELHGDCKIPKFKENQLIEELEKFSFKLTNIQIIPKYKSTRYYTFKMKDSFSD